MYTLVTKNQSPKVPKSQRNKVPKLEFDFKTLNYGVMALWNYGAMVLRCLRFMTFLFVEDHCPVSSPIPPIVKAKPAFIAGSTYYGYFLAHYFFKDRICSPAVIWRCNEDTRLVFMFIKNLFCKKCIFFSGF